jgi:hypothetical protein
MSKLDQMRRLREEQYARQQQRAPSAGGSAKSAPKPVPVVAAERAKAKGDAEQGKCSVCGKLRTLSNGLVSNHQKGLGKMCPGSRKEPA